MPAFKVCRPQPILFLPPGYLIIPVASPAGLPRILLVEDHDMTRRMQIRFLSRSYAVDFASAGEEAIGLAAACAYETVLIDIGLAGKLTGVDVMRALKHMPAHQRTAMVAVTGYASENDRERLVAAGFDLYLAKPFKWQEFSEVIRLAICMTQDGSAQRPSMHVSSFAVSPAVNVILPSAPLDGALGEPPVVELVPPPFRQVYPWAARPADAAPALPRAPRAEPVFQPGGLYSGDTAPSVAGYNPFVRLRPSPPPDVTRTFVAEAFPAFYRDEEPVLVAPPAPPPCLTWQPLSAF